MGTVQRLENVRLVMGVLYEDHKVFEHACARLRRKFGAIRMQTMPEPFIHTDYYNEEMGNNLTRVYMSFEKLIPRERLPSVKLFTNAIEDKTAREGKRRINLDPGYIDKAKLVLASTKDFFHRIYVQKGIFAEVTLHFQKGAFITFPWTYPDYKEESTIRFFTDVRRDYIQTLKD